jgi:hypothetical protein
MVIDAAIGASITQTGLEHSKKSAKTAQNRAKTARFNGLRAPLLHYGNNGAQTFRLRQN